MDLSNIFYVTAMIFMIVLIAFLVFVAIQISVLVKALRVVINHVEHSARNFRILQEGIKLSALKGAWNILRPFIESKRGGGKNEKR